MTCLENTLIAWFGEIDRGDVPVAGGKGASLSDMVLAELPVPPGFVVCTEAFRRFLYETDLNEKIIHIVAEGDFVVTHFISSGTFKESMGNIPATGKRASNPEIAIHRIENGKIAEQWTVSDRLNMLTQLGIQL